MHATTLDGELLLDGEPTKGHPYNRRVSGKIARYPRDTNIRVLESLMGDRDTAYSGRDKRFTFTYRGKHGTLRVAPYDLIGINERSLSAGFMGDLYRKAREWEGFRDSVSVAGVAGQIFRKHVIGAKQLQPRWRRLAHAAIHQGPMACCAGWAAHAVQYDRRRAFLAAMYEPVPIPGSWCAISGRRWDRIRRVGNGIVKARVEVDSGSWFGRVPPLPVSHMGKQIYPTGTFIGTWTVPHLICAEDLGCRVVEVIEAATCRVDNMHARAADRICEIDDDSLRKLVYTRYWGRMAARGGYFGTKERPDVDRRRLTRIKGSSLFWQWGGIQTDSHLCPPDYMPDHAAYISSRNSIEMAMALASLEPYQVIGTHIDAIWVAGPATFGNAWKVKGNGILRFYGVGTYNHAGEVAAQGVTDATVDIVAEHGLTMNDRNRAWHFRMGPGQYECATSDPLDLDMNIPTDIGDDSVTIYDNVWTNNGWRK